MKKFTDAKVVRISKRNVYLIEIDSKLLEALSSRSQSMKLQIHECLGIVLVKTSKLHDPLLGNRD
jgi:hypothetical protein